MLMSLFVVFNNFYFLLFFRSEIHVVRRPATGSPFTASRCYLYFYSLAIFLFNTLVVRDKITFPIINSRRNI
ncbi:hypothetical protein WN51_10518 [Melipona quadrifasciata]|uniref:Uncharacterized protein n=1 Tax=Melipona quadrifasciata TaxID=166423 RepID=A0A0M9A805_9HYME|nr:hypothetical protein WN51_10518 [Melipona quadrifasciata]